MLTFLFTDIEDSVVLRRDNDTAMLAAQTRVSELIDAHLPAFPICQYHRKRDKGDSSFFVFSNAKSAILFAAAMQQALYAEPWVEKWGMRQPIKLRMGLSTGEAVLNDGDYDGIEVDTAARICALGHGRRVLLSDKTLAGLAQLPASLAIEKRGEVYLKGIPTPQPIYELMIAGLPKIDKPLIDQQSKEDHQRIHLLDKLRAYLAHHSPENAMQSALIDLKITARPDAVLINTGWGKLSETDNDPMPAALSMAALYQRAGHKLLILGEPGAGKTTQLLDLMGGLLKNAERNLLEPMPVLLKLSAWDETAQNFPTWVAAQMRHLYDVKLKQAETWLNNDKLILLLDGLDEVAAENQEACVEAINRFQNDENYAPEGLVITCRKADYATLDHRLKANMAFEILPLTDQQVSDYCDALGGEYAAMSDRLAKDKVLAELVTTPLMLRVLTVAFRDLPNIGAITDPQAYNTALWGVYVTKMQARLALVKPNSPLVAMGERAMAVFQWLANHLSKSANSFYVEDLQPSALDPAYYRRYIRGLGLLIAALVGVAGFTLRFEIITGAIWFCGTLMVFLLSNMINRDQLARLTFKKRFEIGAKLAAISTLMLLLIHFARDLTRQNESLVVIIQLAIIAFLSFPIMWLTAFMLSYSMRMVRARLYAQWGTHTFNLMSVAWAGLIFELGYVLIFACIYFLQTYFSSKAIFSPMSVVITALDIAFSFILGASLITMRVDRIRMVERLRWSWRIAWLGLLVTALVYIGKNMLRAGNIVSLEILSTAAIVAMVLGLGGVEDRDIRLAPEQGLQRVRKNAQRSALVGLLIGFGLAVSLFAITADWRYLGVMLTMPMIWALRGGLISYLQHKLVRRLLARQLNLTGDLKIFLDDAVQGLFLRKFGGRYVFWHKTLMDYFRTQRGIKE
ncbi:MAG: NACHT domain-containing protein [Anaerolineae bacterium]|nr:NACHT domain-containing protein [Anaerolineae bacterium]